MSRVNFRALRCRIFVHELVAAPTQTERMGIAAKIIKLMIKSVKEFNYALAAICCNVLTCTEGVPPPLEYITDDSGMQKLIPVRVRTLRMQFARK